MFLPKDKYRDLLSSAETFNSRAQPESSAYPFNEPISAFETKPKSTVSDSEWTLFQCRLEYTLARNKS
jgi:hypothetical protein